MLIFSDGVSGNSDILTLQPNQFIRATTWLDGKRENCDMRFKGGQFFRVEVNPEISLAKEAYTGKLLHPALALVKKIKGELLVSPTASLEVRSYKKINGKATVEALVKKCEAAQPDQKSVNVLQTDFADIGDLKAVVDAMNAKRVQKLAHEPQVDEKVEKKRPQRKGRPIRNRPAPKKPVAVN